LTSGVDARNTDARAEDARASLSMIVGCAAWCGGGWARAGGDRPL